CSSPPSYHLADVIDSAAVRLHVHPVLEVAAGDRSHGHFHLVLDIFHRFCYGGEHPVRPCLAIEGIEEPHAAVACEYLGESLSRTKGIGDAVLEAPVILCEKQERERVVPAHGELDFHYAALPQGLGPHADEALLETCLDFRQLALGLECFGNAIIKRHLAVLEG